MKPRGLLPKMLAWADRHPRKAAFLLSLALHVNSIQKRHRVGRSGLQ